MGQSKNRSLCQPETIVMQTILDCSAGSLPPDLVFNFCLFEKAAEAQASVAF